MISFENFFLLWKILPINRRSQLLSLQVLCLLAALGEVANLGALMPVLRLLASADKTDSDVAALASWLKQIPQSYILPIFGLGLLTIVSITTLLRVIVVRRQLYLGARISADLSKCVYSSVLSRPYTWHIQINTSEILSHLSHDVDSVFAAVQSLLMLGMNVIIVSMLAIALIMVSPIMMIISSLILVSFYFVVFRLSRETLQADGRTESLYYQRALQIVQESLGGIRDVILDHTQTFFIDSFHELNEGRRLAGASINIKAQTPRYLIEGLTIVLIVGIAIILAWNGKGMVEFLPLLGTFALGFYRLLQPLQQCFASFSTIQANQHALLRLKPLLVESSPISLNHKISHKSCYPRNVKEDPIVLFNKVSFRYPASDAHVIQNISLSIRPGERIALIGKTGSGKTTVADLVLGLLKPTSGLLILNGYDMTNSAESAQQWQSLVAHVPQHIYLADSSFASNIAFGIPTQFIDNQRVRSAARQACIEDLIESTSDGYQTVIGERGVRLSGGQRQRIGIARALYKRAKLLVLDEATSALDIQTESEVMKSILSLNRTITVILIAHRLATVRHCDRVVYLVNGAIRSIGTFSELEKGDESFRSFVTTGNVSGPSQSLEV